MPIRWGIIGCGAVTEVKSGPALQKAEGSALVAVMRRTASLAEGFARRHGVPRWYTKAQALIADREVDAVYIATPPGAHLEYALKVCAAGKPAYVEKPMARNYEEGRLMVQAFRASGLPLFVAYYRRALPRFLRAKQLLESGRLGRLRAVTCRYAEPRHRQIDPANLPWRLQAEYSGGGLFMDLGCHALDALDFLLGPLQDVTGSAENRASPYDVEDTVRVQFRTQAGAEGEALWDFATDRREDRIVFVGTAGRLAISTFGDEELRLETASGVDTFAVPDPPHVQQPLIQTIVDELLGRGTCPSTGDSALRTAAVMDKALEGYYGPRQGAFWSRPQTWPGRPRR